MAPLPDRRTRRWSRARAGGPQARSRSAGSTRSDIDGVPMGTATGAQLLVRMLKAEGVRHLFTLSGLHIAPIYAACVEEGIDIIDTRHEQAPAHAADATARLTRGIGVGPVTAGPGGTNALTGIANAYAADSPGLLLGGAAPSFNAGQGSLQGMGQGDLFTRIPQVAHPSPSPRPGP